ncbi:hypothetical protein [Bacillus paralicheniformis]|nr:hypothetical protein [Bacillus paralicheniformis]
MKKVKAMIAIAVLGSVIIFGFSNNSANTDEQATMKIAENAIFG